MKRLIEYPLEEGGTILVEVNDPLAEEGIVKAARGDEAVVHASQTFEQALDTLKPAAGAVVKKFRLLPDAPDSVQVEFGIKLSAQAGALIASTALEANFKVALTWKKETQKGE